DRVTDENAQIRVLDPGSPLLSKPNKITQEYFADWVQERGLYMPRTFDPAYRTVFAMNDKGDAPQDGAVLIAPLGKGVYVYTTFAFFRELPAGNPGAARLFVNLLSATPAAANRPPHPPSGAVRPGASIRGWSPSAAALRYWRFFPAPTSGSLLATAFVFAARGAL